MRRAELSPRPATRSGGRRSRRGTRAAPPGFGPARMGGASPASTEANPNRASREDASRRFCIFCKKRRRRRRRRGVRRGALRRRCVLVRSFARVRRRDPGCVDVDFGDVPAGRFGDAVGDAPRELVRDPFQSETAHGVASDVVQLGTGGDLERNHRLFFFRILFSGRSFFRILPHAHVLHFPAHLFLPRLLPRVPARAPPPTSRRRRAARAPRRRSSRPPAAWRTRA